MNQKIIGIHEWKFISRKIYEVNFLLLDRKFYICSIKQTNTATEKAAVLLENPICGNGKKLYIITIVNDEDTEDTHSYLQRANDEDDLYNQVKNDLVGDLAEEEMEDDPTANAFEDDWGIKILYSFIGEIQE